MSELERVMWWALGILFAILIARIVGPMAVEYLDAHCATWRYVAILVGGATLLGTVSYCSDSEGAVQIAVSIIPMMLVMAGVVAFLGIAYAQLQHQIRI